MRIQSTSVTAAAPRRRIRPRRRRATPSPSQAPRAADDAAGTQQAAKKEDPRAKEFRDKVTSLVRSRFGGSIDRAFAHYDRNKDGGIDKKELLGFLKDAKIGNWITRGFWAKGILKKLDKNGDGKIQRPELVAPKG